MLPKFETKGLNPSFVFQNIAFDYASHWKHGEQTNKTQPLNHGSILFYIFIPNSLFRKELP